MENQTNQVSVLQEAFLPYWKNYVQFLKDGLNFSGSMPMNAYFRATRLHYALIDIYNLIVQVIISLLVVLGITEEDGILAIILFIAYIIAITIPSISSTIRRLHDTGRSGWNLLWLFIPILGWIYLWYLIEQPPKYCETVEKNGSAISYYGCSKQSDTTLAPQPYLEEEFEPNVFKNIKRGIKLSFNFSGADGLNQYWRFLRGYQVALTFTFLPIFLGLQFLFLLNSNAIMKFLNIRSVDDIVSYVFLLFALGLVFLIPLVSATIRRLHGAGFSGKNIFWALLPIIGWLRLWYLLERPSKRASTNKDDDLKV